MHLLIIEFVLAKLYGQCFIAQSELFSLLPNVDKGWKRLVKIRGREKVNHIEIVLAYHVVEEMESVVLKCVLLDFDVLAAIVDV